MPSWKRVLTSGSDAQLNSVYVPGPAINQLTASVAITALNTYNSTALNSGTVQRIDSASVTWSIQHNLNEFWPIVYVWQEDPDYVYTPVITDQIKVISQNSIEITFPTASRGYVNVSRAGHIVSGSVPWTNLIGDANVTASLNIYGNVIANQGFTGSLWGTSSWSTSSISSSYSVSSSMALSASWAISSSRAISASFTTTASYINELRQKVGITGSIDVSGSGYINGKLYINTNGITFPISTNTPSGSSGKNLFIGLGGNSVVTDPIFTYYGANNIGIGSEALYTVSTGNYNTAIGSSALYALTTGVGNVAIGEATLANITTGTGNIAIGQTAGNIAGSSNLQTNTNSIYIGNDARGGTGDGQTNEIVIGASTIGKGSNTILLGNNSIIRTYLIGNVAIGSITVPTAKLHVSGANASRIAHFFSAASPNAFVISGSGNIGLGVSAPNANLVVSGSAIISGSLTVLQGITSSLFGTSSWAQNVTSASYAYTASSAVSASWAISASRALSSVSSSYAYTASSAVSASYAETASYANNFHVSYSLTASGLKYPSSDNGEESFIQTDGNGNLSLQYVKTIYEEIYNGEATSIVKGTPLFVSGAVGAASIVYRADAANPSKMPVVYVSADTIASGETGRGIALGLIKGIDTTGYTPGTEIYIAAGGGWTNIRPTGSAIVQVLGYVTKEGSGGQGVVLNPGPSNLPNINSGNVWVGNTSSIPTAISTASLSVLSSSYAYTASSAISSSYATSASRAITSLTSSYSLTASFAPAYLPLTGGIVSGDLYIYGTASIAYLNVTYESSSIIYSSGSNQFGDATNDVQKLIGTVIVSGSQQITGSLNAPSITGSLQGTSSWSNNSISASYAYTASSAVSSSYAYTASSAISSSFANSSVSASYAYTASSAISASWAISSSRAISSVSASYSYTASSAESASFAQTSSNILGGVINSIAIWNRVTSLSSSAIYQSSSNIGIGTTAPNALLTLDSGEPRFRMNRSGVNHIIINHDGTTGVLRTESATPLDLGTNGATRITILSGGNVGIGTTTPNAKLDVSGSAIITGSLIVTQGITSSLFGTSSWSNTTVSASYAYTASSAISASFVVSSSYAYTASSAISASVALTASFLSGSVTSASYAYTASSAISASFTVSASRAISSLSASYAYTASSAESSSYAYTASSAISASWSISASRAISASWAPSNLSGSNAYIAVWSGSTSISTSSLYQSASSIGVNTIAPTATVHIKGNGSTLSTKNLILEDNTGKDILVSYDNSFIEISGSLSVSGSVTTYIPPKIITGSYTLVISDAGKFTEISSSGAVIITIPEDSAVHYPIGAQTMFAAFTTSSVSFTTGSNNVTLRSSGNRLKLLQQYSGATLVKRAANDWYIFGDMSL